MEKLAGSYWHDPFDFIVDVADGLIDSLHIASVPVLLGQGELLFDGLDLHVLGLSITERKTSEYATHLVLEKA
jgi:dihydrofolate reductase